MGTTIKHTTSYTPQQNAKVERAFSMLFERAHVACNSAKLLVELQKKYFAKLFKMQYKKKQFYLLKDEKSTPPYIAFFGEINLVCRYLSYM